MPGLSQVQIPCAAVVYGGVLSQAAWLQKRVYWLACPKCSSFLMTRYLALLLSMGFVAVAVLDSSRAITGCLLLLQISQQIFSKIWRKWFTKRKLVFRGYADLLFSKMSRPHRWKAKCGKSKEAFWRPRPHDSTIKSCALLTCLHQSAFICLTEAQQAVPRPFPGHRPRHIQISLVFLDHGMIGHCALWGFLLQSSWEPCCTTPGLC